LRIGGPERPSPTSTSWSSARPNAGCPIPRFAYVAPQLNQAKDIAWTYLKEYTAFFARRSTRASLWVELPGGARIRIYGADNPDRLRGIYLDGVVLDEFGDMDPTIWTQVIRPALSIARAGPASLARPRARTRSTSCGWNAEDDPDWTRLMLKASETGLLDDEGTRRRSQDDERRRIRAGIRVQLRSGRARAPITPRR
jgi:hypothetical protein